MTSAYSKALGIGLIAISVFFTGCKASDADKQKEINAQKAYFQTCTQIATKCNDSGCGVDKKYRDGCLAGAAISNNYRFPILCNSIEDPVIKNECNERTKPNEN